MVYLLQKKLAAVARPVLVPGGGPIVGVVETKDYLNDPAGDKAFFASGPNSSTAYSATVSIWTSFDGVTYDPTPLDLAITNLAPDASSVVTTPCTVFAASLVVNSGTITVVAATNNRDGVYVGLEG